MIRAGACGRAQEKTAREDALIYESFRFRFFSVIAFFMLFSLFFAMPIDKAFFIYHNEIL